MSVLTDARTGLRTEIVPVTAGDGMQLNLHHVTGPTRRPRARCCWSTAPASAPTSSAPPRADDPGGLLVEDG